MTEPEPIERPEGFEGRAAPLDAGSAASRPDWLVGADDVLEERPEAPERPRLSERPPRERPDEATPTGPPNRPTSWSAPSSSVPKLRVVPRPSEPDAAVDDDGALDQAPAMTSLGDPDPADTAPPSARVAELRPPEEPWWLVVGERLATDRRLWAVFGVLAVLAIANAMIPRGKDPGVSLSAIKRHPERYEGRSVTVRGRVGEVFEVGQGYVFHLHQGRDTVVVFSPERRPKPKDGVVVAGTVTTGYLDGTARIAVFENP